MGVVVVDNLRKPDLSAGVEVALERLVSICKRDGYELASANLRIIDKAIGTEQAVSVIDGEWYEVEAVRADG